MRILHFGVSHGCASCDSWFIKGARRQPMLLFNPRAVPRSWISEQLMLLHLMLLLLRLLRSLVAHATASCNLRLCSL